MLQILHEKYKDWKELLAQHQVITSANDAFLFYVSLKFKKKKQSSKPCMLSSGRYVLIRQKL